jgi:ribose transport system permease protein
MSAFIERITGSQVGGATERSIRLSLSIIRLGPAIILLLLVLAMTLLSPVFLTGANISNVVVQTSVLAVLAIGQLFVILVAGIDLSVGSVLGLSTVTGAIVYTATSGAGGLLALLVILLTGVVCGWINGFLYVKGKMPHPFIPTLAMLYAARGLALVISDGRPIPGMSPIVVFLGSGYIGPIPMPVIVVAALAALAIIVTRRLKWGRWIYAVGGDRRRRAGKVYPWTGCLSRCSSSAVSWQGSPGCSRRAGPMRASRRRASSRSLPPLPQSSSGARASSEAGERSSM